MHLKSFIKDLIMTIFSHFYSPLIIYFGVNLNESKYPLVLLFVNPSDRGRLLQFNSKA